MANPLKFGPTWVRNNGKTDMKKLNAPSNLPWDKSSKKISENFNLTEMDELRNSLSTENNEISSSIPSYSSVLRGSQSKTQNEKPAENGIKKSKELGVVFERNYCQRNGGPRGTSIKLVDSILSSNTNETSALQGSDSLVTNSKEFSKMNGDKYHWRNTRNKFSNETSALRSSDSLATNSQEYNQTNYDKYHWRNTRDLYAKKEQAAYNEPTGDLRALLSNRSTKKEDNSCKTAEKNSTSRVASDFNHRYSQKQTDNKSYYRDNDVQNSEKSKKANIIVEENWRVKKDLQQTNCKNKSPKSVRWLDENPKIRKDEASGVAQNMINDTYPNRISSLELSYELEDNHKCHVMDVKKNETTSSYEDDGAIDENFDVNKPNPIQGFYMSKEDIDIKLAESIKKLLTTDETFYLQPSESSYEPWPQNTSPPANLMPSTTLHTNPVTNPFHTENTSISIAPVSPPNNNPFYQHNSYCSEPSIMNPNPMILQLPRMVIPALNDTVGSNPFLAPNIPTIRPPIMMVDPASNHLWYYRDPHCRDQGPFSSTEMAEWYSYGYFDDNLQLKRVCDTRYVTLGELILMSGNNLPFLASHLIPPLHNLSPSHGNPFS